MKLVKATFKNFRILRDVKIKFSTIPGKNLTVIRAENESGKTTLLTALQWALFGDSALPSQSSDYRLRPIDWDVSQSREVLISAEIEFEHVFIQKRPKGKPIVAKDTYVAIRTTTEKLTNKDEWIRASSELSLLKKTANGFEPLQGGDLFLRQQILGSNLKDLFFTDGDRALSFITSDRTVGEKRKMVEGAIRDMLGLQILEEARKHVSKAVTQIRTQVKDVGGSDRLAELSDSLVLLDSSISKQNTEIENLNINIRLTSSKIEEINEKIAGIAMHGDRDDLVTEKKAKEELLKESKLQASKNLLAHTDHLVSETLAAALTETHIKKCFKLLNDLKEEGKIPRNAIPVLRERLELQKCICGAPLHRGDSAYNAVQSLIEEQENTSASEERLNDLRLIASTYLGIQNPVGDWVGRLHNIVSSQELSASIIEKLQVETKELESKIDNLPDADITALKKLKNELKEALDDARLQKVRLEMELRSQFDRREKEQLEYDTLVRSHDRYQRLQCRLDAANSVLATVEETGKRIKEITIPKVSYLMNAYFLEMIQAEPTSNSIICESRVTDQYDIAVFGPNDERLDPDKDLNGASRRALTIAFILALSEVSSVEAPNVIDTPLGMMSGIVKQSVLETAAKHSSQLVLLLTRSEIAGCEHIIDEYAGVIATLSSSAHYPSMLRNQPNVTTRSVMTCNCTHREVCQLCERRGDEVDDSLAKVSMRN